MELPHIGKNCALEQCNRLDFLPVKCDACLEVFCIEHYKYDTHNCEKALDKNNQVPVCPLCSEPVSCGRDRLPDVAVSQHIDQECKQNELIKNRPAKPKQTSLQACHFKSCNQKDLIYLECKDCRSKFCIRHRHPSDHLCPGPSKNLADSWNTFKGSCSSSASSSYEIIKNKAHQISRSGQAALNRIANSSSNRHPTSRNALVNNLQGGLSEQEALAIALNESSNGTGSSSALVDEDAALARALHESELEARRNRATGSAGVSQKDTCILS